jgi:hypothetical protein
MPMCKVKSPLPRVDLHALFGTFKFEIELELGVWPCFKHFMVLLIDEYNFIKILNKLNFTF